ncbi:hypothetical protein HSBAA_PA_1870 (plasmid) [Vreelandella sulfidaeris]|uniref:Uncharacterized protein n=1 Tax=Vreelandella sulfidaeris TaxID=115553 RepID=A0A455URY0_9GAMM|nr:hypothetical protein HSBAA_PA_1870 [Halomonas sulfidaeris]
MRDSGNNNLLFYPGQHQTAFHSEKAFSEATVTFALEIVRRGAALLVVGDETSAQFPEELKNSGSAKVLE